MPFFSAWRAKPDDVDKMVFVVDFGHGVGASRRLIGSALFRHLVEQGQIFPRQPRQLCWCLSSSPICRFRNSAARETCSGLEAWTPGTSDMGALKV
jgi:hypothetical protein